MCAPRIPQTVNLTNGKFSGMLLRILFKPVPNLPIRHVLYLEILGSARGMVLYRTEVLLVLPTSPYVKWSPIGMHGL